MMTSIANSKPNKNAESTLVSITEKTGVITWLYLMVFSYFIVIPITSVSTITTTDLRLYDVVFIFGLIFIILPNFRLLVSYIDKTKWLKTFFIFTAWISFTLIMVLILSNIQSAIIAAVRIYRFFSYGMVAVVITTFVKKQKTLYNLLWFFFILSAIEGWLSFFQYFGYLPNFFPSRWDYYGMMPTGTLGPHHLQLGVVSAMAVCIGIALLYQEKSLIKKLFIVISIGIMVFASFAVESRTGWVSVSVGALFVLINLVKRVSFDLIITLFFIGAGLLGFIFQQQGILLQSVQETYERRFESKIEKGGIEGLSPTRIKIIQDIPVVITKYPWVLITGAGAQNSGYVLSKQSAAHNNYLHAFLEGGIIGFVLYIRMVFLIFRQSFVNYKKAGSKIAKTMLTGFQGAFLTIMVANLFNEAFYMQYASFSLTGQIMALSAICLHYAWVQENTLPIR